MRLHTMIATPGRKKRKRIGRGEGGGKGKTSGRGHKGQKSRTGSSLRPGFESGHVPLYRRLPKRGFSNFKFRTEYEIVNVGTINELEGDTFDRASLAAANKVDLNKKPLKILGDGELTRAVTVTAEKFTASAKAKIEAAGGKVILISEAKADDAEKAEAPAESDA